MKKYSSAVACVVGLTMTAPSLAQDLSAKPLRLVIGFAPGGSHDIIARVLGARMGASLNQQPIVDNRTGANGIIAADFVAKAPPDGYTLMLTGMSTLVLNPLVYTKVPYEIFVAHPGLPVKSLKELADLAKRSPGKLTSASPGIGGISHLTLEIFKGIGKFDIEHVAYKGTAPALTDLIGGYVPLLIADLPAPLPYVKSGKLRALAVTGEARTPLLPNVSTAREQGFPALQVTNWIGVVVPARTPAATVERLRASLVAAVDAPDTRERYATIGVDPLTAPSSAAFGAFMREEFARWEKVVRQTGIQLQQ
jgi:tripartite-type tricarboxylate transporter receptor subunit TctC